MATITAGIKHSSRAGVYPVDNDAARFLKDHDGTVAHTAKTRCLACFAIHPVRGVSVGGLVSLTSQQQASPEHETIV